MVRGWHQGYPKKLGSIWITRPVRHGKAGPHLEPGGRFGASVSVYTARSSTPASRSPTSRPTGSSTRSRCCIRGTSRHRGGPPRHGLARHDEELRLGGSEVWTARPALVRLRRRSRSWRARAGRDDRRLLAKRLRDRGSSARGSPERVGSTPRRIDRATARRLAIAVQGSRARRPFEPAGPARRHPLDPVRAARPDRGRGAEPALVLAHGSRGRPQAPGPAAVRDRSVVRVLGARGSIVLAEDHPIQPGTCAGTIRDDGSGEPPPSGLDGGQRAAQALRARQVRREGPVLARRIAGGLTGESWRSSG